jgi:hypothetical protein
MVISANIHVNRMAVQHTENCAGAGNVMAIRK